MTAQVSPIIGDSAEIIGLILAALTLLSLLLGLLWKLFEVHRQVIEMGKELKPNHGSSLRDQIDAVRILAEDHSVKISGIEDEAKRLSTLNEQSHQAVHRRIDGLFELLAGANVNASRRTAETHRARSQRRDEEA